MSLQSAAILTVSEEILQHKKCDSVTKFLIQELNNLHYNVGKITVIPNRESTIVNELHSLIKNFDIIIVVSEKCDTIFKAISGMTSQELTHNDNLIRTLEEIDEPYDKDDIFLPSPAKLLQGRHVYPVIYFQRIFILKEKHVLESYSKSLKNHLEEYRKSKQFTKTIYINQNGNSLANSIDFSKVTNNGVIVELSKNHQYFIYKISSLELTHIIEFEEKIKSKFQSYCLRSTDDSDDWDKVYSNQENHVKNAIENIEMCLNKFGIENVFLCFNGGKDCTVLLHLVLTVVKKKYPNYKDPIFCLYVQSDSPFPEQEEFINQTKHYYNLQVMTVRSGIKDALQETLEKNANYKACFMGTRRTDPFSSGLNVFQMTDSNWPQIMRVSPLLDWHYCDVWDYLLYYKVPYCSLYDEGYTSLGNTINTTRNPSLIYYDQFLEKEVYLPAYKLLKENKERRGRNIR